MGKQKDFRHVHHLSHKKKDKKSDKTSKPCRSNCYEGYLKSVEGVVQAELESIASTKKIGRKMLKEVECYPLLVKAVFLGCERVVDNILEAGENVNVQVQGGKTPLIMAVENGCPGIVQKLLKKGADPKLRRQDGRNALMIAVSKNDNRSFTLIWNYWDKSNFSELNHSDLQGYTVLTIAAEHGHYHFANLLLSLNGIEIDKQTKEGQTALMFAVVGGDTKIVHKFLTSGSDIVLEDKNGATAICLAIIQSEPEIKSLLIESLDSKSRDTYVKKRIELLSRPRSADNLVAISFCKDILFRVILEVRRSFEDGVALLEKYKVLAALLKCMKKYQQDTELLRIGFHLAVCIMYDKAEYSRYIVEELAEQYIAAKGADFSLKVMHIYRVKSLSDLRGAAFLAIHAGSQCLSGQTWLRANYFQLLPFVKEFRMVFPTLNFWVEGESVKARIMFERFEEMLLFLEKDLKGAQPREEDEAAAVTVPQIAEKNGQDSVLSSTPDQRWCLVSNSKSGSNRSTRTAGSQMAAAAVAASNSKWKAKNKGSKLQTKLQHKMTAKKLSQRSNAKFVPDMSCASFPALPTEVKFSQTGYADALKKNLRNEAALYEITEEGKGDGQKDTNKLSPETSCWSDVDSSVCIDGSYGNLPVPEKEDLNNKSYPERKEKNEELDKMKDLYSLWSKISHSENSINLMAFIVEMFKSNTATSDGRNPTETAASASSALPQETKVKECCQREFLSCETSDQRNGIETADPTPNAFLKDTVAKECFQRERLNSETSNHGSWAKTVETSSSAFLKDTVAKECCQRELLNSGTSNHGSWAKMVETSSSAFLQDTSVKEGCQREFLNSETSDHGGRAKTPGPSSGAFLKDTVAKICCQRELLNSEPSNHGSRTKPAETSSNVFLQDTVVKEGCQREFLNSETSNHESRPITAERSSSPLPVESSAKGYFQRDRLSCETSDEGGNKELDKFLTTSALPQGNAVKECHQREIFSCETSDQTCSKEMVESLTSSVLPQEPEVKECPKVQKSKRENVYDVHAALKLTSVNNSFKETVDTTARESLLTETQNTSLERNNVEGEISDVIINGQTWNYSAVDRTETEGKNCVDLNSTFESDSSFELKCSSQTSSGQDISFSDHKDSGNTEDNYDRGSKRKWEDNLPDLSYHFHKEEMREPGKEVSMSVQLSSSRQYSDDLYKVINVPHEKNSSIVGYAKLHGNENLEAQCNRRNLILNSCTECSPSSVSSQTQNLENTVTEYFSPKYFQATVKQTEVDPTERSHLDVVGNKSEALIPSRVQEMPKSNRIECIEIPKEQKHFSDILLDGAFEDLKTKSSCKRKLNLKNFLKSHALLSFNTIHVTSSMKLFGIQKHIYERMFLQEAVGQLRMSLSRKEHLDAGSHFPASNLVHSTERGEFRSLKSISEISHPRRDEKLGGNRNFQKTQKKYDTPSDLKTEFAKFTIADLLHSRKIQKQSNSSRQGGIKASKTMGKERRKHAKFVKSLDSDCRPEGKIENDTKFIFCTHLYGYKPQFINCEFDSRWYKILRRIESCVPLALFLTGFMEADRSFFTDCTMHELVCSSGKVVFSTKKEHVLRDGEDGTYMGIMSNGNPVVVRQFQKSSATAFELMSKKCRVAHRNVVAFYCLCSSPTDQKLFAVSELLEYSLPEYFKVAPFKGKILVQELVDAVKYLHEKRIVHGFLKPSNVMVAIDHRLKVSDFYQLDVSPLQYGVLIKGESNAPSAVRGLLSNFCWRPYELIAAGNEVEARRYLTTASDIQMTGMLIYYILSGGRHPFGSSDLRCQVNILRGFPEFGHRPSDVESRDLVHDMIERAPSSRLGINRVARHPYLWNGEKRFQFLVAVSRKIDFFTNKPTKIAGALQDSCIEARDWTCYVPVKLLKYVGESTNKMYVDGFADLLRFIGGVNDNFKIMPPEIKSLVHHPSVFVSRTFPTIFMSVYSVVRDNPCSQRQMALQSYF